jgi:hypothetical protein
MHWLRLIWSIATLCLCVMIAGVGCDSRAKRHEPEMSASHIFADALQLQLAKAVAHGDVDGIAAALEQGADIDKPGRAGIRMLMWAMLADSVDGFSALLDRGANVLALHFNPDIMRPGQKTYTVAEYVCVFADKTFLDAMLTAGFDVNQIVDHEAGQTVLFYAVLRHDCEAVRRLIDAGAEVSFMNSAGRTPLSLALSIKDFRIATYLQSHGADPLVGKERGSDAVAFLRRYGSRGVTAEQRPFFVAFVESLRNLGLITWEDIQEADKPRQATMGGQSGVTVMEHAPGSEVGRAIRQLDEAEREAIRRSRRERVDP